MMTIHYYRVYSSFLNEKFGFVESMIVGNSIQIAEHISKDGGVVKNEVLINDEVVRHLSFSECASELTAINDCINPTIDLRPIQTKNNPKLKELHHQ